MRRATIADRAAVVRTLVRAFDRDPVAGWLLRGDAHRARAFELAFDASFRWLTLPLGGAMLAEEGEGVALWAPPSGWSTWRALPAGPWLAYAVGVSRLPRVLAAIARVQAHHPKAPHWYLFAIGVDPRAQGRGLGSALLRAQLARCDELGEPAYLEASTEENARIYARHGFRALARLRLGDDGPPLWPMWREPRAS